MMVIIVKLVARHIETFADAFVPHAAVIKGRSAESFLLAVWTYGFDQ